MNLRLAALPAPPSGAMHWSITTLAAYLCVPPAEVDKHLIPDLNAGIEESPDFHSIRLHHSYRSADGEWLGDVHLTDDAADRIASALPSGLLARRIVASHPAGTDLLGPDHIHGLAHHIVTHLGGGTR